MYIIKKEEHIVKTELRLLIMCALLALLLGGCGCFRQQMKGETPPPPAPQVIAPEVKEEIPVKPEPLPAPVQVLKDVNFDFDKYNIKAGDGEILKENTGWFTANPGKGVKIEGNCDERGTVEYNLALGQRRADSTKEFLVQLGVDGKLLKTVSYGKEKPICQEHNEGCWSKNRRAHFVPIE
jgi:peptidoglycan-associated lipoprotein